MRQNVTIVKEQVLINFRGTLEISSITLIPRDPTCMLDQSLQLNYATHGSVRWLRAPMQQRTAHT